MVLVGSVQAYSSGEGREKDERFYGVGFSFSQFGCFWGVFGKGVCITLFGCFWYTCGWKSM